MVALGRKQSKIFASNAPLSQITVFRTTQTDSPQTSTDPNIIQNDKYLDGWLNADNTGNMLPFAEDMNAVLYTLSYNTSYLYEKGIPEYSATQVYYENSFCQYQGKIYRCKLDDTLNYVPTTTARWDEIPTSSYSATTIGAGTVNYGTVYAGTDLTGTQFQFKTIIGGSNVTITEDDDSLTISASVEGQTANFTANSPLNYTNGVLTIPAATSSQSGYLTAADWTSFNSKLSDTIFSSNNSWTGSNSFTDIAVSTSADFKGSSLFFGNYSDTNKYSPIYGYSGNTDSSTLWATIGYSDSCFNFSPSGANSTAQLGVDGKPWNAVFCNVTNTLGVVATNPVGGNFIISSTDRLYLRSYSGTSGSTTSLVFGAQTILPESDLAYGLGDSGHHFNTIFGNKIQLVRKTNVSPSIAATVESTEQLHFISYLGGASETKVFMGGNTFLPGADDTVSLGFTGSRWKAVYAANGTIQTSDRDKKTNIIPLESGLETLNKLPIYSYTWKKNITNIVYGLIAQEAVEVAPELIDVPDSYQDGDGTLGVFTSNVLFLAVKAIQELSAKVDSLEQQLKGDIVE